MRRRTGEALAGILQPGNAGSNTAADHIEVIDLALAQLPTAAHDQPRLVRADSGGATHAFTSHLRKRGVRFSVSLPADERVRAAVLAVAADAWQPASIAGGQPRPGAEVAELHTLELAGWPPGTRAICRREDPHPGAQLTFTDADGHRFQVFITDQPNPDITTLGLRHRRRARVEDRIRCGKATGLRNLPLPLDRHHRVGRHRANSRQDPAPPPASPARPADPLSPTASAAPADRLAMGRTVPPRPYPPSHATSTRLKLDPT